MLDSCICLFVAVIQGESFLPHMEFLELVNHQTVSTAVIKCLHNYNIAPTDVLTFVTDNAAYCLKAVREILLPLYPNATHMACMAHITYLVAECWEHDERMLLLHEFVSMFKSSMFKKGARKQRLQQHLQMAGMSSALPP